MRKAKRILSILLSVIMIVLTLSALSVLSSAVIDVSGSGKCGDNISWSLSGGVLTVTGTGELKPAIRKVERETSHWDPESQQTVYENEWVDEEYFPWEDTILNALLAKFGVENEDEIYIKMQIGTLNIKEFYKDMLGVVTKLVIGEGITAIDDYSFSGIGCAPQIIILPSTLTTLGEDAINTLLAAEIVINNPALDFEVNEVEVSGFDGETTFATVQEAIDADLNALEAMYNYQAIESLVEMAIMFQQVNEGLDAQIKEINDSEDMTDEEKAAAIAALNAEFQSDLAIFKKYYGFDAASLSEIIAQMLAMINQKLGTSYASVEEFVVVGEDGKDISEDLKAKLTALEENAEAVEETLESIQSYTLGSKPEATDYDNYDPETGYRKITLTPAPWLTVYGAAESTAQAACAVSQVKFVALDAAKAAFDAQKTELAAAVDAQAKDGDSDASKKLIADAKAAIAAVAYDNNKSPEENKAAVKAAADAIAAKLASDLNAQRGAECHWCGKVHGGNFFQKIIAWFHNIFAKLFGKRH